MKIAVAVVILITLWLGSAPWRIHGGRYKGEYLIATALFLFVAFAAFFLIHAVYGE